ncbi:MAG: hypothetical protein BWY75_03587 [bacterium ADurb.Bin425]|nr:MAG: hypothetical protein BWY75_03587 [bacterium ADurb.Bin425]
MHHFDGMGKPDSGFFQAILSRSQNSRLIEVIEEPDVEGQDQIEDGRQDKQTKAYCQAGKKVRQRVDDGC